MRNIFKSSLLALTLLAGVGFFSMQSASAHRVIIEEPVLVEPTYEAYPAPAPTYWGPAPVYYDYGPRPFSLHRFLGNAAGGAIGASKNIIFGHDRSYYYW